MSDISASLVKNLRERTGAGMMECKNALKKTNGNIDDAVKVLRETGQAKAEKKLDRETSEGLVSTKVSNDSKFGVILVVACETDFVAREPLFKQFVAKITEVAVNNKITNLTDLLNSKLNFPDLEINASVNEVNKLLISRLGENISISQFEALKDETIVSYVHGGTDNGRIGVLLSAKTAVSNPEQLSLLREISMHIAAIQPKVLSVEQLSAELIAKEHNIYLEQSKNQYPDKSMEMIEKISLSKLNKWKSEVTLLEQKLVTRPEHTVSQILRANKIELCNYVRFAVGKEA